MSRQAIETGKLRRTVLSFKVTAELRAMLETAAEEHGVSLTEEVMCRLHQSFDLPPPPRAQIPGLKDALAEALREVFASGGAVPKGQGFHIVGEVPARCFDPRDAQLVRRV